MLPFLPKVFVLCSVVAERKPADKLGGLNILVQHVSKICPFPIAIHTSFCIEAHKLCLLQGHRV